MHHGLPWEDYQQAVIDKCPSMLAGSSLGTAIYIYVIGCFKKGQHGSRSKDRFDSLK